MYQEHTQPGVQMEVLADAPSGTQKTAADAHDFIKSIARTLKVLVAEDDRITRRIITRTVEHLGHECVDAADGESALAIYGEQSFDVIISDWMMPGMDGKDLCRQIRSQTSPNYTYFILLTALNDHQHRLKGMRAGADDFLTKPLNRDDLEARLISAMRITALHQKLADQAEQLEFLNRQYFEDGRRDRLTGVGNRLKMEEELDALSKVVGAGQARVCLALVDIDHFKSYNDTAGHMAGDEALASVAKALDRESRKSDAIYRYGGEEFLIILPDLNLTEAQRVLERVREAVEDTAIPHPGKSVGGVVTISVGVVSIEPGHPQEIDAAIKLADEGLYEAKENGRNRVIIRQMS